MTRAGLVLSALLAITQASCLQNVQQNDQRNGPGIAEHIRDLQSPIVAQVLYQPGDVLRAATIILVLRPGVGAGDASAFICTVAYPYAEASDPPYHLRMVAWDGDSRVVASDTGCR
jgi:hypothetical protein